MQINMGEPSILEILPNLTEDEIQNCAADQRMDAFGLGVKFMQRPKPSEIVISATQKRYEPFWYGVAHALYRYDRRATHQITLSPSPFASSALASLSTID
ncbi:MAG: hypothetical protein ABIQ44_12980 [Chloroflexia bacterium]